ncbi:GNAT family N-acetyltransferase [Streptomyces sp. NBC_00140]|uniref:GNAT family N-acetyltransferase n=1 Tax=Streptomyces sp. NBC_00140 TaxID=2975664 RepID=UPI0022532262|nr:GNAT family N-acetyltransferase [Streptomyces sp. NBC_00140]MCX5331226.1 GNAT family N-acetyltransferase [Streptomyces sp. NBC_00140]
METLRDILDAAALGVFPPPDGSTTVVPQASARDAGVLAFTAHSVVFTDEDPRWVYDTLAALECDPLAATMNPGFLAAFMARTGRTAETIDAMFVGSPLLGEPPLALAEITDADHPRIAYARGRRDDVRAWTTDGGVLVAGRGIGGRLEVSLEVDEDVRHRGLGRLLLTAARQLVEEPLWAQVAPGNARSTRAFQAAGYRPVGAEALLLSARPRSAGCSDSRS